MEMAPPAYLSLPPDYELFGFLSEEEALVDEDILFEAPLSDYDLEEGFGPVALPYPPGNLHEVPGLTTSPGSSAEVDLGPAYYGPRNLASSPETAHLISLTMAKPGLILEIDTHLRVLYSCAAFQYSYSGKLDIEYFDAVIDNTENSLVLMRNLAVIPRCDLEKEKFISKIEATPASWDQLSKTMRSSMFYLLAKLLSRVSANQLESFQMDEPNTGGDIFPTLQRQLSSLRHLSLHETSLVSHFADEKVPRILQSLVIHGININVGGQFLTFLLHLGRYHNSLSYLSLDFEKLSFEENVDWIGLERHFSSIRVLTKLKSLVISNCRDMMALQFSTLVLIPWTKLKRLKIINCPSTEAGGCPGLTRRLRVDNLTHLSLIRTCSPEDAAALIRGLGVGLQRLHLEFSYEQGQMSTDCLMKCHSHTLRYLWMESSTGKRFRLVESTTGKEPLMSEFARFKRLRELAIAVRYAAIEKYDIEWENPPNLRIFRILNLVERYVHQTKEKERCVCKIAESFARIHDDELAEFHSHDLQIIIVGRHINTAPDVEPIYYWANVVLSDSDSDSSSTNSNPLEGMRFGGSAVHDHFVSPRRRQRHSTRSHEPSAIQQQSVEYDAGDEAEKGEEPPSPSLPGLSEPFASLNLSGQDNDDEENPALGIPDLPERDEKCCVITSIDELKTQIRETTIIEVDLEGAPFWEQDEMIVEPYYPNAAYNPI
ncbi:hypothetical protein EYR41_010126 [Orbilia oligospora]|uniref:Uncharacterized protein n=1 Tax=Orbilia oligospora TaxID=2813651 RepID=A0A8H2DP20_ORBOL|nr:hypothetical protein EYR41_010126 [Orbilia oligospora]